MNERLKKYIDKLFENAPHNERAKEFKEEMLMNNQEKYDELIQSGMSDDEAYTTVISGIGDMDDFFEELKEDDENKKSRKRSTKRSLPVFAIILIVVGAVAAGIAITVLAVNQVAVQHMMQSLDGTYVAVAPGGNITETSKGSTTEIVEDNVYQKNNTEMDAVICEDENLSDLSKENIAETVYEFNPSDISNIQINWITGDVSVFNDDVDMITVTEGYNKNSDYKMTASVVNGTLYINYIIEGNLFSASGCGKTLTVVLPEKYLCKELNVSSTSANVDCLSSSADEVDIETVSGNVKLKGNLRESDISTVSGRILSEYTDIPDSVEIATTSGETELYFDKVKGINLEFYSVSGNLDSDFDLLKKDDGKYIYGSKPFTEIDFSSVSADLKIGH